MKVEKFVISRDDSVMEGWPDLIRTSSGRLIVIYNECTAHTNRNHTHITLRFSDDNGESFYGLSEIPVPGMHRPFAGRLNDGRILLSYREFPAYDKQKDSSREGTSADLKACIFREEELKNAKEFDTYYIDHDNSEAPDQGYSAWVQSDDGKIIMANYIVDDAPKAYIRGYRIEL